MALHTLKIVWDKFRGNLTILSAWNYASKMQQPPEMPKLEKCIGKFETCLLIWTFLNTLQIVSISKTEWPAIARGPRTLLIVGIISFPAPKSAVSVALARSIVNASMSLSTAQKLRWPSIVFRWRYLFLKKTLINPLQHWPSSPSPLLLQCNG